MRKTLTVSIVSLAIFLFASLLSVSAQSTVSVTATLDNPFNCGTVNPCTLYGMFAAIINDIILPIGGVLAVIAFIYSGFLYVLAQGNDTKIKKAHQALLYTAIGTAVLLGAWVIAMVIENTVSQLTS